MAQQVRQSRLFAAEDYTAVYESYVNANFQAFDFDTIRSAMVDYVRNTYPENYNDWVESSEFVALLDVVAQFGHNLAYRLDLNSRNNFLSTAQRQDSVLKLAEFLGYQPRRNLPAFGDLKIVSIKTNETVIGSLGTSLGGQEIRYESTSGVTNIDDFLNVINAVLAPSNQFGSPRKQATINNVITQFYNLNNTADQITFAFSGTVLGSTSPFTAVGVDYNSTQRTVIESEPNPSSAFTITYRNDGKGLGSAGTGFFVGFKQGSLQYKDFAIENSIGGLTLDIDINNINQTDVWVQTIDQDGFVLKSWTKVDAAYGNNAIYNTVENGIRDIFAVKTRANNQISVQFPDDNFGNIPRDIIRVWYRVSENSTFVLRPDDIAGKKITVQYVGADGNTYSATLGLQLKSNVSTASISESMDSIKTNAPRVYATQDRMITAQDYNSLLLTQSDAIAKLKSINRTHSGHSRYVDLNDPTGLYTSVRMYATDGTLAREEKTKQKFVTTSNANELFESSIRPILADDEVVNLYYDKFHGTFERLEAEGTDTWASGVDYLINDEVFQGGYHYRCTVAHTSDVWQHDYYDSAYWLRLSTTTWITATSYAVDEVVIYAGHRFICIQAHTSTDWTADSANWRRDAWVWSTVGLANAGTVSGYFYNAIDTGVTRVGVSQTNYLKYITVGAVCKFTHEGQDYWAKISNVFADGLGVDSSSGIPTGRTADLLNGAIALDAIVPSGAILDMIYPAFNRQFTAGEREVITAFINAKQKFGLIYDYKNGTWDVLSTQPSPSDFDLAFPERFIFDSTNTGLDNNWIILVEYDDSTADVDKYIITTRVVRFSVASDQIEFSNITNEFLLDEASKKKSRDTIQIINANEGSTSQVAVVSATFYVYGYEFTSDGVQTGLYNTNKVIVTLQDNNNDDRPDNPESFRNVVRGEYDELSPLRFEWKHIPASNELVDPSFSNLIDVFVLTRQYDTLYRNWLNDTRNDLSEPLAPTIDELNQSFSQIQSKKAMSDTIIYRPVKYRVLFGPKANTNLQAKFRVIKVLGVKLTDNEVKNKVVEAVYSFFNIENWDFGETFYFTELAAYVHKELPGILSSFVIVPEGADSVFGDLFQITPASDEMFIPDVSVTDIDIIDNITQQNIRAN
jgi:hypothetical protein